MTCEINNHTYFLFSPSRVASRKSRVARKMKYDQNHKSHKHDGSKIVITCTLVIHIVFISLVQYVNSLIDSCFSSSNDEFLMKTCNFKVPMQNIKRKGAKFLWVYLNGAPIQFR